MPNVQDDIPVTGIVRNRPPLPGLPSYGITAIVLSYTGYTDEVQDLLEKLSHKTANYFIKNTHILRGALVNWNAKIVQIVEFEDAYSSSSLNTTVQVKIESRSSSIHRPNSKMTMVRMETRA